MILILTVMMMMDMITTCGHTLKRPTPTDVESDETRDSIETDYYVVVLVLILRLSSQLD